MRQQKEEAEERDEGGTPLLHGEMGQRETKRQEAWGRQADSLVGMKCSCRPAPPSQQA